jgi:membrane protease YdiL (CAAX protease family)
MTLPIAVERRARISVGPAVAITLGCLALAARTIAYTSLLATAAVGLLGIVGIVPRSKSQNQERRVLVALGGLACFLLMRLVSPPLHQPIVMSGIVATVLAAAAEEAFFRRFVYGWLVSRSATIAVVGSAVLFALIHVPVYGVHVLPLDFAAGLLLGWQRWASGSWAPSAVTHVFANLLQLR